MTKKNTITAKILLWVVILPILLKFVHVVHHHSNIAHKITHIFHIEHSNHSCNANNETQTCEICEYEWASFQLGNSVTVNAPSTDIYDIFLDVYVDIISKNKLQSFFLRGPPINLA